MTDFISEFEQDMDEDLVFLLDEFGRPAVINGVRIEKVLIDDEGRGADESRNNVNVQVQSLIVKEIYLARPKSDQKLVINGEDWVVTKTDSLEGVLSIQLFREFS